MRLRLRLRLRLRDEGTGNRDEAVGRMWDGKLRDSTRTKIHGAKRP